MIIIKKSLYCKHEQNSNMGYEAQDDQTPLHTAATSGNLGIVWLLQQVIYMNNL